MTRALLLLILLSLAPGSLLAAEAPLIIEYDRRSDGIIDPDSTPLLRVDANGTARIHFPAHHVNAGDWTVQLTAAELARLEARLRHGALTMPRQRLVDAVRQAAAARPKDGLVRYRSEHVVSRFVTARDQPLQVADLHLLARRAPGNAAVADLADVEQLLLALTRRADRRPDPAVSP